MDNVLLLQGRTVGAPAVVCSCARTVSVGNVQWGWFFPFHYAPMASDLCGICTWSAWRCCCFIEQFAASLRIEFVLGQPFKPFEQVCAVAVWKVVRRSVCELVCCARACSHQCNVYAAPGVSAIGKCEDSAPGVSGERMREVMCRVFVG